MANEYLGECHALCFIENRKGISQTYPKIEELVQLIHFFGLIKVLKFICIYFSSKKLYGKMSF